MSEKIPLSCSTDDSSMCAGDIELGCRAEPAQTETPIGKKKPAPSSCAVAMSVGMCLVMLVIIGLQCASIYNEHAWKSKFNHGVQLSQPGNTIHPVAIGGDVMAPEQQLPDFTVSAGVRGRLDGQQAYFDDGKTTLKLFSLDNVIIMTPESYYTLFAIIALLNLVLFMSIYASH